jgi:hypothetical protein
MSNNKATQIKGMMLIVERRNVNGLKHWGDELETRKIPAVIQIEEDMIDKEGDVIKNLSDRGFEVGGAFNERPFWNESYRFQHETASRIKDKIQSVINKPMRILSSKYFAYNEDTLRVADALGIEYVLARGTAGAKAVVYKAEEYATRILSVSNIPTKEMGSGSLCDEALWCRGVTPDGFREILFGLKKDRIILVAQTHLSGVKLHWWKVYQDFFSSNIVTWESLDEFVSNPIVLPNAKIPVNTEVKYVTPQPKVSLEREPNFHLRSHRRKNAKQKPANVRGIL